MHIKQDGSTPSLLLTGGPESGWVFTLFVALFQDTQEERGFAVNEEAVGSNPTPGAVTEPERLGDWLWSSYLVGSTPIGHPKWKVKPIAGDGIGLENRRSARTYRFDPCTFR